MIHSVTSKQRLVENIFFFALLIGSAYLMWLLFAPFAGALALAAIIVTISFPLHEYISRVLRIRNKTFAAFVSLITIVVIFVLPLFIIGSLLLREAISVYSLLDSSSTISLSNSLTGIEHSVQQFLPEFSLNIQGVVGNAANFIASSLLSIFAGTASTLFYLFIVLIATFYFFRDGNKIIKYIVQLSPLDDDEDSLILKRIAISIRSVTLGSLLVAIIQGILTGFGLALFGFDRAVLWGCVASISALIPGVGTTLVLLPAVLYLLVTGAFMSAGGLAVWAVVAVGLIDNILGPHLMSRGTVLHPFIILLSALGGIALFGPIGFILGPVITSLFVVLTELYASYLAS